MTKTAGSPPMSITRAQARNACVRAAAPVDSSDDLTPVLRRLVMVQLDSINALARAHALTLATRVRGGTAAGVDDTLWSLPTPVSFEYWGHAASLIPIEDWPLWAFRRRATRRTKKDWHPDRATCDQFRARILSEEPLTMRQLRTDGESGSGWSWSPTKRAVEYLVWAGELICARRDGWHRPFDLPERVVPDGCQSDSTSDEDCIRTLLERAGQVLAIATIDDFADYLRIRPATVIEHLPYTRLVGVRVDGLRGLAWAHPDALEEISIPVTMPPRFVGPFDNLIGYRKRVSRIFGFDHVFEAYKPATKRQYGYYVCPLLVDDRFIGRADLACTEGRLRVVNLDLSEPTVDNIGHVAQALEAMMRILGATAYDIAVPTYAGLFS